MTYSHESPYQVRALLLVEGWSRMNTLDRLYNTSFAPDPMKWPKKLKKQDLITNVMMAAMDVLMLVGASGL